MYSRRPDSYLEIGDVERSVACGVREILWEECAVLLGHVKHSQGRSGPCRKVGLPSRRNYISPPSNGSPMEYPMLLKMS